MTTNWFGVEDDEDEYKQWTLADIYNDLGSRSDICRTLNVTPYCLHNWLCRRERIKFPQPVLRVGNVDVYSLQECKDWYRRWKDPARKGRREDSKWMNPKPYGAGASFFTFTEKKR